MTLSLFRYNAEALGSIPGRERKKITGLFARILQVSFRMSVCEIWVRVV